MSCAMRIHVTNKSENGLFVRHWSTTKYYSHIPCVFVCVLWRNIAFWPRHAEWMWNEMSLKSTTTFAPSLIHFWGGKLIWLLFLAAMLINSVFSLPLSPSLTAACPFLVFAHRRAKFKNSNSQPDRICYCCFVCGPGVTLNWLRPQNEHQMWAHTNPRDTWTFYMIVTEMGKNLVFVVDVFFLLRPISSSPFTLTLSL